MTPGLVRRAAVLACCGAFACDYLAYDALHARVDAPQAPVCAADLAECDGSAATVCESNLKSNPKHCGACGHDCRGTACRGGLCEPEPLVTSLEAKPGGLLSPEGSYDGFVFWVNEGGTVLRRLDKATGLISTLATLDPPVAAQDATVRTALAWNWIYWVNPEEGVLRRAPAAFAGAAEVMVAADVVDVASQGGNGVSWLLRDGRVFSADATSAGSAREVAGAIADAKRLVEGHGLFVLTSTAIVRLGASPGTSVKTLADAPVSLSVARSNADASAAILWGTAGGRLGRRALSAWEADWNATAWLRTDAPNARSIRAGVDAQGVANDEVYWISGADAAGPGDVYGIVPGLRGGAATKLSNATATELVLDAEHLYWIDSTLGTVLRLAR